MWRSNVDDVTADAMRDVLATEERDDLRRRAAFVLAYPEVAGDARPRERRARFAATVESLMNSAQ